MRNLHFKKLTALFCAVLLLMQNVLSATALSGNTNNIKNDKSAPAHDISVMSFNILERETSTSNVYAKPKVRGPMVIKQIVELMPDVIGIQEAADSAKENDYFDWNDYLIEQLQPYGYDCRYLTQESIKPSRMTIGAGLMILYKRDRFELKDHGSQQYKNDGKNGSYSKYQGFERVDNSRYFHYVKLFDKKQGTHFYVFNTHLSVPVGSLKNSAGVEATAEQRNMLCFIVRTKQAAQLAETMESLSGGYPCFATGDYNSNWNNSIKDDPNRYQLRKMTDSGTFRAAADDAIGRVSVNPNSLIDHIFYNVKYNMPLQYRGISENFGGYQPSDHRAMICYFNYAAPITFSRGSYDPVNRIYTDTIDSNDYGFHINHLPAGMRYQIADQYGGAISEPFGLNSRMQNFTLQFYNGEETLFTLQATLTDKRVVQPDLQVNGAQGCYYKNGIYYVAIAQDTESVSLDPARGKLYNDASCTRESNKLVNPLVAGKTILYLKDGQNVYPIHLLKATQKAERQTLYVDTRFSNSVGTLAYEDCEDVVLVTKGTNGFATISDAAKVANNYDGYTIYVAPGHYEEQPVFTKNVKIYGNNRNISPIRRSDEKWSLSEARLEETVLDGSLIFDQKTSNTYTVHGFTFASRDKYEYAIYQTYANQCKAINVDIRRNIFRFRGINTTNSSCIMLNDTREKTGIIADNYFSALGEASGTLCRVFSVRNPNGLLFEENYCINFVSQLCWLTSEIAHTNTSPGNMVITFRYNRFDNCNNLAARFGWVTKETRADFQMLYNDFVGCGNYNNDYALKFYLSDANKLVTDYSDFTINVFGNRFIECQKALYLTRDSAEGKASSAHLNVTHNRFIGMHQGAVGALLYLNMTPATNNEVEATSPNWDFSHNFYSTDISNAKDPLAFADIKHKYNNKEVNFLDPDLFYPYYTNAAMTTLSAGKAGTTLFGTVKQNNFTYNGQPHALIIEAPEDVHVSYSLDGQRWSFVAPTRTLPGETAVQVMYEKTGYTPSYETITLKVNKKPRTLSFHDSTVIYNAAPQALAFRNAYSEDSITYIYNGTHSETMPRFTDVGSYTVQITVSHPYYETATATATLCITPERMPDITLDAIDKVYDGKTPVLTYTAPIDNLSMEYSYFGSPFSDTLDLKDAGEYTVFVRFTHPNYQPSVQSTTVHIRKAEMPKIHVPAFEIEYDDTPFTPNFTPEVEDATVEYSLNARDFEKSIAPEVGGHSLWVRISKKNYTTQTVVTTLNVLPRPTRVLSVQNELVLFDGQAHGITVTANDLLSLEYSVNGGAFTDVAPSFTEIGTYHITVKGVTAGYEDLLLNATFVISDDPTAMPFGVETTLREKKNCSPTLTYRLTDIFDYAYTADFLLTEYGTCDLTDTTIKSAESGITALFSRDLTAPTLQSALYFRYTLNGVQKEQVILP